MTRISEYSLKSVDLNWPAQGVCFFKPPRTTRTRGKAENACNSLHCNSSNSCHAAQIVKLGEAKENRGCRGYARMSHCPLLVFIRAYPRHPRLNSFWFRPQAGLG